METRLHQEQEAGESAVAKIFEVEGIISHWQSTVKGMSVGFEEFMTNVAPWFPSLQLNG